MADPVDLSDYTVAELEELSARVQAALQSKRAVDEAEERAAQLETEFQTQVDSVARQYHDAVAVQEGRSPDEPIPWKAPTHAGNAIPQGRLVTHNGEIWYSKIPANTTEPSEENYRYWDRLGEPPPEGVWSGFGQSYRRDDVLEYEGQFYIVLQDHISQPDWAPNVAYSLFALYVPPAEEPSTWVAGASYSAGDVVLHGGATYTCLQPHVSAEGLEPGVSAELWEVSTPGEEPPGYPLWGAGVAYTASARVVHDGRTYECRQAHTSQAGWEPPNVPALWADITPAEPEPEEPPVEEPGPDPEPEPDPEPDPDLPGISEWAAGVAYAVGEQVTYGGVTYEVRQAHTSQVGWEPPNAASLWLLVEEAAASLPPEPATEEPSPEPTPEPAPEPEPESEPEPAPAPAVWQPWPGYGPLYQVGDEVTHNGKVWRATVGNNHWEPGVYGWVVA